MFLSRPEGLQLRSPVLTKPSLSESHVVIHSSSGRNRQALSLKRRPALSCSSNSNNTNAGRVACFLRFVVVALAFLSILFVLVSTASIISALPKGGRENEKLVVASSPHQEERSLLSTNKEDNNVWWEKEQPLLSDWPQLYERNDILPWLEKLKFRRGVEVGVQRGILAKKTLGIWKSCEEYKLVDLWGQEQDYKDFGRDDLARKNLQLRRARAVLEPWTHRNITEFFVMRSTHAAKLLPDNYFDYIYIDARHDYCAVMEDLTHYWPKVRPGGILAGHDYVDAAEAKAVMGPEEDWSLCENGTVEARAVKGAVQDFAAQNSLYIVTTHEGFYTWLVQKPYDDN